MHKEKYRTAVAAALLSDEVSTIKYVIHRDADDNVCSTAWLSVDESEGRGGRAMPRSHSSRNQ
jgi:hypothetical protein